MTPTPKIEFDEGGRLSLFWIFGGGCGELMKKQAEKSGGRIKEEGSKPIL